VKRWSGALPIGFALWLIGVLALNGVLTDEPIAMRILRNFEGTARIAAALKPYFTAAYQD
jgi:hypothetical protein